MERGDKYGAEDGRSIICLLLFRNVTLGKAGSWPDMRTDLPVYIHTREHLPVYTYTREQSTRIYTHPVAHTRESRYNDHSNHFKVEDVHKDVWCSCLQKSQSRFLLSPPQTLSLSLSPLTPCPCSILRVAKPGAGLWRRRRVTLLCPQAVNQLSAPVNFRNMHLWPMWRLVVPPTFRVQDSGELSAGFRHRSRVE